MPLPTTTKGSTRGNYLPYGDALKACFDLCKYSKEAADYFAEKFSEQISKASKEVREQSQEMLKIVKDFANNVGLSLSSQNPWLPGGYQEATNFQTMQLHLAEEAATKLSDATKEVQMDYALGNNGEFLRGYSVGGQVLQGENVDAADKLFNAWLAENNLLSRDSALYQCDANGESLVDNAGNPVRANPDKVKELINDPTNGFQSYLQRKGIQVVLQDHTFPTPKGEPPAPPQTTATSARQEQPDDGTHTPTSSGNM